MGKITYNIFEDNWSRASASTYELSILLGVDSFTYMVSDRQQQILALKEYQLTNKPDSFFKVEQELQGILSGDELLQQRYRNIRFGLTENRATLVPNRLYNPNEKDSYFKLLAPLEVSDELLVDDLGPYSIKNVYAVEKSLIAFVQRNFPGNRTFHISSALIMGYRPMVNRLEGSQMYLNVKEKQIGLTLFKDGKIQFINTYGIKSTRDFTYYVLLVFDQFGLNPEKVPLHISGRISEDSESFQSLFKYIKNIHFVTPPAYFRFGTQFNQPKHFFFDLFSLIYCN